MRRRPPLAAGHTNSDASHWPVKPEGSTQKSARYVTSVLSSEWTDVDKWHIKAAEKSLGILRASPEQATIRLATGTKPLSPRIDVVIQWRSDGPHSEDLLRPVFMGCATRNAKVVAISLGSLQRLIAMKAVPQSAVPLIISTMNDCVSQGVDIQLRILQTLLSLITNFPAVHGALLGEVCNGISRMASLSLTYFKALLLCFKLQDSRIAVVSSTAAATLRQLVMFVVDKVVDEDKAEPSGQATMTLLPDESSVDLEPSARDAFSVFEDLCLLANSERPKFLKLESLHKTFALELIESVLTNYHDLFHKARALHNALVQSNVTYCSIPSSCSCCNIIYVHFFSSRFPKDLFFL